MPRLRSKLDGGTWSGTLRATSSARRGRSSTSTPGIELFDWGYALTVHKAQGSEAPLVVVFEECGWMESEELRRRWRYTAYTRAAERLLIVG
jgi:superfamily I DNA/RNA helicase